MKLFSNVSFHSTNSNVTEVVVGAKDFLEKEIVVEKDGTLIGWKFWTAKHDIGFAVFHKKSDAEVSPNWREGTDSDVV